MADNNNDAIDDIVEDEFFEEEESDGISTGTKIVRVSNDPKEMQFSITFDKYGGFVSSSKFSCFGCQWRVTICPNASLQGTVAVLLERCSEGRKLKIIYSLAFTKGERRISKRSVATFGGPIRIQGWYQFCSHDEIVGDFLNKKGSCTIHVMLQLDEFIPKNPASPLMLKLFDDENSADIVFDIRDKDRATTSTAKYHKHRLILQHYSPELSDLCATSDGTSPIIITDVKPKVFRHLLYYVYGGDISYEDCSGLEKELINAADKYGVTNLKLEAEVWYVHNKEITFDNVIDNLLYADAKNCALLKEAVMDFIVENKEMVIQRVSFQDVPYFYKDLLAAMSRHDKEKESSTPSNHDTYKKTDDEMSYSQMRIRDLRQKLHDKGLDIDGSRETLIARLTENS